MTDVQARPAQLNTFGTNGRTIHTTLETARTTNKSAFVAFRNAAGGGCAAQGDGIVNGAMTDLLSELDEIPKWVRLVHDALIAADVTDANGNVSISPNDLTLRMIELAGSEKTFNELANSRELSVPLPQVGTVPPDSGFVNDPVCTATGHLLVDARDFVMPPRLDVLSFRRTYASQYLHDGAFGPGWWSWTECHGSIATDGSFEYVGPDAQELRLPAGADGRFIRRPELDIDVEALDDSTVRLRWGRRSRNPNQVWTFVGDRLAEVSGPFVGTTRFEWDRRGHLTSIGHDSGRTLAFRWKGSRVVGIESSDGRRARFEYSKAGHLVAVDNGRSPERYELDDEGRILWVTDADDVRTITMTYDDEGRVIAQVSETGFMTRFNYDEVRRTTLSDRDYNPLSVYTHDASGRVEMYATGGGYRFTRRFDALGRVVSQRDADGTSFALVDRIEGGLHVEEISWSTGDVERFEYDGAERLVRQSSARSSMSFTYDGESMFPRRIEVAGDQGLAVDLEWAYGAPTRIADSDGVVDVLTIRPDGTIESTTNGLGQTTRYEVDACGYVTRIKHPDGSTVRYQRDPAGHVVAMVDAAGHRGEIRYTAAGRMLSATDPNGAVTAIEYYDAGLPARVVAADGTETEIAFDDEQRVVGIKFANGDSVGLDLDEWGRQVAIEADDRRWETERDASGRIVKRRDPSGDEIAQEYGELGGWMSITDAAGANWRLERDMVSRVRTLTTPSGREITARYNAEGMLTAQSTSDGAEQEISYTSAGRVESATTGEHRIEFRYDAAGRMIGANTGSGWWTFDLDSNGRIVRRVSPAGREQRYGYNVLDQLTSINVAGEIWEFEYDTAGRVVRSTDPTRRSSTYDYDAVGRMIESRDGLGTPLHYAYDPRGRIAAMIDGHDGAVRYEHNGLNQLTAITDQLGRRTNVHYDDAGRHVATTWLDPRRDARSIPTLDQFGLDGADAVSFGDGVEPLAYSVSADGTSVTWTLARGDQVELKRDADGLAVSLSSPDFTRTWTRDDCGRVITVVDDRAGVMSVTTLRRDAAGRVIDQTVDGAVTQFGYDDAGQLVSSTSESGRSTWEYDELGRLIWERTPDVLRSFRYDDAHQLVELTEGGAVTTFEYDARGRRVRAAGARDVVYVWGSTHLEAVVVDGVVQRFDTDASGALRRAGDVEISWDTSFGTPRPVSVDGQRVLTVDGSTVGTVSSDGSVKWRPFKLGDAWGGEPEAADHAEWHDYFGVAVDGLVWLGARPYDVVTRQFLAPDPLAPLPGMPGSTSPYTYAANDPVNLFDPTGRQPISIEAWNDVRDRRTGPQWQNIASVAIAVVAVAVTVVTLGSAGPLVMVLGGAAIGALAGGASGLARESIESNMNLGDGQFNGDAIVKDVIVGAAGGALGGGAGAGFNALASTTRIAGTPVATFLASRGGSAFAEGVSGFGEGVMGEVYDVTAPRNWGADGTWNNDAIVTNTVVSTVAGGALHGVGAPGTSGSDVPTTSSADPADIDLPNSPTPNQPDPAPASADTGSADTTTSASEPGTTNSDTGGGSHDTGADTSTDTSSDTNGDTSSDTRFDTSADTSNDTTSDTSGDTSTDTSGTSADTTSDTSGDTTSDTSDTSTDTTSDTSTDTTSDRSSDTTSDSSGDTSTDTSGDTTSDTSGDTTSDTSDTSTDTTSDTSTDTTSDTSSDTTSETSSSDTSTDATSDTSRDTTSDTSSDTTSDTSHDASADTSDTSTDTTSDTSGDTTSDTSSSDTSTDTSDTSGDTTSDTSTETTSDNSSSDTSTDATSVTSSDTSSDTTSDTSADAASDTNTDTTSDTNTDTTSDTADTTSDTNTDTTSDTADSSSDTQTDTTPNADPDTDTDASNSNGDTDTEVAAAAAVVAPTTAAASASSASSASAASSASTASGADTPSTANNGGDPPTTNGDSNDTAAGDGDSERLANIKADERNVSTRTDDNGMTRITREHDANSFEFTVDADGYTRAVKFEINESYAGLDRTSAETSAQDRAAKGGGQPSTDDGGHMAGHRFSYNQGDINQMAQNSNLNRGAYKKWENEMADWTARGYEVEGTVHANQPGGTRPDTIDITYVVSDASGNVVHYGSRSFVNQQGQTFNRVYGRQMDRATTLFEGRRAGDAPPSTFDAPPASNGDAPAPPAADGDASPTNTTSDGEPAGVGATPHTPPLTDSGSAAGTNTTPSTELADVDLSGPDAINTQTIDNQTIDNETIDNQTIDNETVGQQSPNDHLPSPRVPVNPVPAGIAAGDLTGGAPAGELTTTMPETAPSTTLDVDAAGDLADSPSIPEPRSPMDAMPQGTEVDAPRTADADTSQVDEVDAPSGAEVENPQVTDVETTDVADTDSTDVTGSTDTDQTVDPTAGADPDAGSPPHTYTVDGQEYIPSFSPDQLNNAPTAHDAADSLLSDNDLFARHGFDPPWTRQDLIDAINTSTGDLTPAQRDMLNAIRDRMPFPQPGETIQKVITPDQLRDYLDNVIASPAAPNTVGGSQTRAADTAHLRTPDELFDGLRLDYDRTPFRPGQNSVHVIRYVPSNEPEFALPRNSTMGGNARFDTWTDPFTGNGFTKATGDVIPEFQGVNTMRSGAEMWEIMSDGTQQLTAVLRGDVWVRVD